MKKEEKIFYCRNLIIEGSVNVEMIAKICGCSTRYTRKVIKKWKKIEEQNLKKTAKK